MRIILLFVALASLNAQNILTITPKQDDSDTGELRFREKRANGAHELRFKSPAALAGNVTWTLPNADASGCWTSDGAGALSIAVCSAVSFPLVDTTEWAKGSSDATKRIKFEVDGLTTATVRTLTVPDASFILAGQNIDNQFSTTQTVVSGSSFVSLGADTVTLYYGALIPKVRMTGGVDDGALYVYDDGGDPVHTLDISGITTNNVTLGSAGLLRVPYQAHLGSDGTPESSPRDILYIKENSDEIALHVEGRNIYERQGKRMTFNANHALADTFASIYTLEAMGLWLGVDFNGTAHYPIQIQADGIVRLDEDIKPVNDDAVSIGADSYALYNLVTNRFKMPTGAGSAKCLTSDAVGVGTWQTCGSGGLPVSDATSVVEDNADGTKELRFEVGGFTTATVRTVTVPNFNFIMAGQDMNNNFSVGQTFNGGASIADSLTLIGAIGPGNGKVLTSNAFGNATWQNAPITSLNSLTGALSITAGTGISVTPSSPNIAIANTGVTAIAGTSPITLSGSTGSVTVACSTCLHSGLSSFSLGSGSSIVNVGADSLALYYGAFVQRVILTGGSGDGSIAVHNSGGTQIDTIDAAGFNTTAAYKISGTTIVDSSRVATFTGLTVSTTNPYFTGLGGGSGNAFLCIVKSSGYVFQSDNACDL